MARKRKTEGEKVATKLAADAPNQPLMPLDAQGAKMSQTLQELVRPYLPEKVTREMYERLVVAGLMAWNIACGPRENDETEIDKVVQLLEGDEQAHTDFRALLKSLITRKRRAFDANKRRIVEYSVTETTNQFRLSIASTPPPDE